MGHSENQRVTLSENEFCEMVGISRITAWRLRTAGKLPHCRVGDRVLYLPRHVDEFLTACERRPRQARQSGQEEKN